MPARAVRSRPAAAAILANLAPGLAFIPPSVYPKQLTMSSASPTNPLSATEQSRLRERARTVAANSYSPYSHFRVGAALLLADGSIVTGCNVENASYRLTSCAEQAAVARAVSERGPGIRLRAVAVANLNGAPSMPCGACRQTLSEFGDDDVLILYPGEDCADKSTTLGALLPHAFRMQFLDPK